MNNITRVKELFSMQPQMRPRRAMIALSLMAACSVGALLAADPPAPPKISSFAPAVDLVEQARLYLDSFDKSLAGEQEYKDNAEKIERDAHTLAVLAMALGNHDSENELQAAAPAVMVAAEKLADAQDYTAAKSALESLHAAMEGKGEPGAEAATAKWACVAPMDQLMKQVVNLNNRIKRGMRRFDKQKEEQARDAAVLATIAEAFVFDAESVAEPAELDRWYQLCGEMRDAAGELNAHARAADKAGAEAALLKLANSCDDCHEAFRIEQ